MSIQNKDDLVSVYVTKNKLDKFTNPSHFYKNKILALLNSPSFKDSNHSNILDKSIYDNIEEYSKYVYEITLTSSELSSLNMKNGTERNEGILSYINK